MADTENNKNSNSPALRFPGFTEPWQRTMLDRIVTFEKKRLRNCDLRLTEYVSTDNMLSDFGGVRVANRISETGTSTSFIKGDILVSNIRPYLNKIWYATFDGGCSPDVFVYRAKKNIVTSPFLYNILANKAFITYVMNGAKGVKMPRGDKEQMMKYPCSIPSLQEQNKISSLLKFIDERIATQRRLIEDLEKLKSSIIEKVYCSPIENHPRLRINQKYAEKWPIYELINICTRITTKNINNESNRVLTIAAQYGLIDQRLFFNKVVASENISNYYLLNKGDFAYNKSYSGDYIWGAVKRLDKYDSGVLSPLYICFRPNNELVDSDYLLFYFESKKWHKGISEIVVEGARNHGLLNISIKDFFNMPIPLPSIDEQREIATMIRAVQSKIEHDRTILQRYEQQRNCLLKEMFI